MEKTWPETLKKDSLFTTAKIYTCSKSHCMHVGAQINQEHLRNLPSLFIELISKLPNTPCYFGTQCILMW